jgi:hypothetical protein
MNGRKPFAYGLQNGRSVLGRTGIRGHALGMQTKKGKKGNHREQEP